MDWGRFRTKHSRKHLDLWGLNWSGLEKRLIISIVNIVTVIKSINKEGHVTHSGNEKWIHHFGRKNANKWPFWESRHIWQNSIKINFGEVDLKYLDQLRLVTVTTRINIQEKFLTSQSVTTTVLPINLIGENKKKIVCYLICLHILIF